MRVSIGWSLPRHLAPRRLESVAGFVGAVTDSVTTPVDSWTTPSGVTCCGVCQRGLLIIRQPQRQKAEDSIFPDGRERRRRGQAQRRADRNQPSMRRSVSVPQFPSPQGIF